jgi:RNA polymerase sigma factor (sigma-70 family)
MDDDSWRLLRVVQSRSESSVARSAAFESLLRLSSGFWQAGAGRRPETLPVFIERLSARILDLRDWPDGRIDPQDVAQDVLLRLFESAHTIRSNPRAWLVSVVVYTIRARFRKDAPYLRAERLDEGGAPVDPFMLATTDDGASPDPIAPAHAARLAALHRAVDELPERMQTVLRRYLTNGSIEETASQVGISASATRVTLFRARERLRQKLVGDMAPRVRWAR